jgi:hypothetical protein
MALMQISGNFEEFFVQDGTVEFFNNNLVRTYVVISK